METHQLLQAFPPGLSAPKFESWNEGYLAESGMAFPALLLTLFQRWVEAISDPLASITGGSNGNQARGSVLLPRLYKMKTSTQRNMWCFQQHYGILGSQNSAEHGSLWRDQLRVPRRRGSAPRAEPVQGHAAPRLPRLGRLEAETRTPAQLLSPRRNGAHGQPAQHGVGAESTALPGALLLPALPPVPPALRGHQAAEELGGQHGRDAAARPPLSAPGAVGLQQRASPLTGAGRRGLRAPPEHPAQQAVRRARLQVCPLPQLSGPAPVLGTVQGSGPGSSSSRESLIPARRHREKRSMSPGPGLVDVLYWWAQDCSFSHSLGTWQSWTVGGGNCLQKNSLIFLTVRFWWDLSLPFLSYSMPRKATSLPSVTAPPTPLKQLPHTAYILVE
ncbi:uncharacterized protein LOC103729085 [Nannospalax galili]|uniref:uncharacterized protein LOC103729085 n=1 Tax=Nannospalax galili TaxID=1026970 RepID=UPI0004ED1B83|nr:uncharacterized protein LOC103729085 [Nannospalax galili]